MAQNGTKMILVLVFLLAGMLVAAQVQAAQAPASAAPASAEVSDWFHNPEPWLEMGADFRFREHGGYNWSGLNDDKLLNGKERCQFPFGEIPHSLVDKIQVR